MFKKFLILLLAITASQAIHIDGLKLVKEHCATRVRFAEACIKYNFKENCWPWNLSNCEVLSMVFHVNNCQSYICPVIAILINYFLLLKKQTYFFSF